MPAYADHILHPEDPAGTSESATQSLNKGHFARKFTYEDVVVSGMSGRFPESSNVKEFARNLYEGVDMVTDDDRRWTPGIFGLPTRSGKLPNLSHFDASFFSVSPRQAHSMDPQLRLLLEVSHEAIFDAGIHPNALRGKRIGVYVGVSSSESEEYLTKDPDKVSGYELTGCCRAMFANRLSYALDLKGPSFAVDTACSSALVALQSAWSAIHEGEIEGAIVAGSNLTLKPQSSLQFHSLSMLAKDGCCKAFDSRANGYVRSEAVTAVFLQRSKDAKRIYAHVVQAITNTDGHKSEGITFPSGAVQKQLLEEVYQRANVDPSAVSYVEAHGTGTKVGDPQEVNSIAEVFCNKRRSDPLLIGSVKSNMGHSEPASGLCAMIKVLLAMQNQEIPANLHFREPNPEIPALNNGKIKVVSENTPWRGQYAAINCFGFGGANVHVLLKSPDMSLHSENLLQSLSPDRMSRSNSTNFIIPEGGIPRLVVAVGRTEDNVREILSEFQRNRNVYFATLLDSISESEVSATSFPYRGYTIVGGENDYSIMNVTNCPSERKPLWLIFSGMGSQWTGCGRRLLELPPFADVIQRCRSALLPLGVDVIDILTREEPDPMASTTASFSAIATVQVGLIEVLKSVGLNQFDGMIGHSVGELGCGYADGALTAEQTVLCAYWRGRAVEEASLPVGGMAAVGLSVEETEKWLEKGSSVTVACHNSANSVTISGLKDEVDNIVKRMDAEGIFVRAVNSGGIAFHHNSLRKAAPRLLSELQKVILAPVKRSDRWISSSVPEVRWDSGVARKASPEYLVNNLVSPVLFAEALEKIPEGARVIEVSPHSLMQAVLRRALPGCTMVPLVRKEAKDILSHLLEAIGKLYVSGELLSLRNLYYDEGVVPANTPSIASLIKWDHSVEWDVAKFSGSASKAEFIVDVDLNDQSYSFLEGHAIDGRVLFPATGYMALVWKALGKLTETPWEELAVSFEDVTLHQATVLSTSNSGVTFTVRILLNKGEFEVLAGETTSASGKIHVGAKETNERTVLRKIMNMKGKSIDKSIGLTPDEVYKELKLRGYQYGGIFRGIYKADLEGTTGELIWKTNWISLLDTMLQFSLLGSSSKALYLPTRIRKIVIDPAAFKEGLINNEEHTLAPVNHNHRIGITTCPGIEIHGLKATMAPRRAPSDQPLLESYSYFPYNFSKSMEGSENMSEDNAVKLLLDIVIENVSSLKLKIVQQILKMPQKSEQPTDQLSSLALIVSKNFDAHPLLAFDFTFCVDKKVLSKEELEELQTAGIEVSEKLDEHSVPKLHLLIMSQSDTQLEDLSTIASLGNQTFILVDSLSMKENLVNIGLVEVASVEKFHLYLLRKPSVETKFDIFNISESDAEYKWVEKLKEKVLSETSTPLWLVSRREPQNGLIGMLKCLRREPGGQKLRCITDSQNYLKEHSKLWEKMLAADLAFNIIQDGVIGTMRHLPLPMLDAKHSEHSYLNVLTRGDLSSLTWLSSPLPPPEAGKETILCSVNYAPLNFRDIMLASGKLPPDALPGNLAQKECILGLEFAGKTRSGERVMGLVPAGGLATTVRSDPLLTWNVPSNWSLKEASTVPVVYATAYYALVVRGDLQKGETVLIHAGSGGVGQAAISIALARGCTVYTTVSSTQKRDFLKERFPQLQDENFANSRDLTFEYDILEHTNGKGVDVVLNSLAGDLLQASVRCLKEHGRFLEIGKADLANNTSLGMSIFLKNVTFHGILLDALFEGSTEKRKILQDILYQGIKSGEVKPLHVTSYNHDSAEEAFRFMASGKHIGKVILEICPDECIAPLKTEDNFKGKKRSGKRSLVIRTNSHNVHSIPSVFRLWPKPDMVYVITGGLGGLGLELADWLIGRGAQKLVLTSRRGVSTGYQALCIKRWRSLGINLRILKQDASTLDGAEKLLMESSEEGPVGGIFHLAMVLEDSILENQSSDKFERVCSVKADGSKQLDIVSRRLCPKLHLWVTFSSVACGKGNPGQSNYGWANSVSERVVEQRVAAGLPGCAIQWGGIADVGVLADTLGNIEVGGSKPQSVRSVLASLDNLIGCGCPVVGSICLSSKKSSGKDGKGAKSLISSIANILGIRDLSKAPMNVSLGDLGLDSLMAVEIKQTLEREIDLVMTAEQIRDLTLTHLNEIGSGSVNISNDGTAAVESTVERKFHDFAWLDYPLIATDTIKYLNANSTSKVSLFVASPIQGTCDVLGQLAAEVNTRVIGLQYPETLPSTNFEQLATALVEQILLLEPTGPIHIGGYSFGASVAVEVVNQLEKMGKKPLSLVLLDGSHSYVSGIIDTYRSKYNVSAKQTVQESDQANLVTVQGEADALVTYTLQFCLIDALNLRNALLKLPNWSDRLNYVAKTIMDETHKKNITSPYLTIDQIIRSITLFYDRLSASFYHDSSNVKISTPTLLVRATQNTRLADFGNDYGLSKVVTGELSVKEVEGTHESFIFGKCGQIVAGFVNEFLTTKN